MSHFQKFTAMIGRMCFSIIFILSGINKIINWNVTEQALINAFLDSLSYTYEITWIQPIFDLLLPSASTLLIIATAMEIVGGILLFLGIQVRFAALLLCLFLIPTTYFFHHFWFLQGSERELQMIMFLKNFALFGGTLILIAQGKGEAKKSPKKL